MSMALGTTQQLGRIMQRQLASTRTVEAIEFTGLSREVEARAGIEPACKDLQSSA